MVNFATKFDPSQPEGFDMAWDAGFRCAEFFLNPEILDQTDLVLKLAKRRSMRYALHFPNRAQLNEGQLDAAIRLYTSLSCQAMVIHPPMMERYGDGLRARLPEVRLGVENGGLRDAKALEAWAEGNEWLTLDVEHLWKYTHPGKSLDELKEAAAKFLERHGAKLVHVHLPGHLPGFPEHRPLYTSREFAFAVWDLLEAHGFEGLVVSEINQRYQNPQELRMDWLLFERWLDGGTGS